jgi:chemotaxis protein CheY-P-specific phosphatase CheC
MIGVEPEEEFGPLASLATSRASESLGSLLCDKIEVKALSLYYLDSPERLLTRLRLPRRLITITQSISGREKGKISLAMPRDGAPILAAALVGRHSAHTRKLGGFDLDAFKETANIVTGSYLSLLGPALGLIGVPSIPAVVEGTLDEIALSLVPQARALCVEAHLVAPSRGLELVVLMAAGRECSKFQAEEPALS